MFISELFETRGAPLYHTMGYQKCMDVFWTDIMPAKWFHHIPGIRNIHGTENIYGNSFSRNKNLWWHGQVRIVVDRSILARHNKIIPLDGQRIFYKTIQSTYEPSDRDLSRKESVLLSEEFVVGDIKNLHKCIIKVEMKRSDGGREHQAGSNLIYLYNRARKYTKKWRIPFIVDPNVLRDIRDTKRGWRFDDDE